MRTQVRKTLEDEEEDLPEPVEEEEDEPGLEAEADVSEGEGGEASLEEILTAKPEDRPAVVGPIAFVALVPLLWFLRGASLRRGALLGLGFGIAYYGILVSWLLLFGFIAWFPLVAAQAAYAALFGLLFPLLWQDRRPLRSAMAAAALWTAIDWARGTWP